MRGYREWEENGEIWDEEREREKGKEENREGQDEEKERHEGIVQKYMLCWQCHINKKTLTK
jgi:hypothetical protein